MSHIVLFNKPFNVLCQFKKDGIAQKTLADYVTEKEIYPAGRLDKDSEGLVILTGDGAIQARISHPDFKLPKTYWVQVEGIPDETALQRLRDGVELKDGLTKPAEVEILDPEPDLWPRVPPIRERAAIPTTWLALTLREGRNRQVRRMTAAVGFPTLRLVRYAIGPWSLKDLPQGETRREDDVLQHLPAVAPKPSRGPRPKAGQQKKYGRKGQNSVHSSRRGPSSKKQ